MKRTLPLICVISVLFVIIPNVRPSAAEEIAILKSASLSYYTEAVEGFRTALPSQMTIKEYNLGGNPSTGVEITRMLRADPPSLVFAVGLKAALAAKLELPDTPVVFTQVLNPELYELPTKHMLGIGVIVPADKQLATLLELVPQAKRIGLLYGQDHPLTFIREAKQSAHQHGLTLIPAAVSSESNVPGALHALLPIIDVLLVIQDHTVLTEESIPFLLKTTLDSRIPIFTFSDTLIRQGALGGLLINPWELGRQAGVQAVQLLRGQTKSLGSILHPEQPRLALNLHVAEYLGITAPRKLIRMAATIYGTGEVAQQPNINIDVR